MTELLAIYPILRSLVGFLNLADLVNLARVNSATRAICRGLESSPSQELIADSNVRQFIQVGRAQTRLWRYLKSIAQLQCSESNHTKGQPPQGCVLCSMPVCQACIVKNSIKKNEATFQSRFRPLCLDCYSSGNPHEERLLYDGDKRLQVDYTENGICQCTAKDGILCLRCKRRQNLGFLEGLPRCAGHGCDTNINGNNIAVRVCLWCNLILPGPRSVDRYRQFYASRFLLHKQADTHATRFVEASSG